MTVFEDVETKSKKKIIRGAYNYVRDKTVYGEEEFEVFKDRKDFSLTFESEFHSRVLTGEMLQVYVKYQVNKNFVPLKVSVKKKLKNETCKKLYIFDTSINSLEYVFKNKRSRKKVKMSVPPRFSITIPTAITTTLFLISKKFDSTIKNYFTVISSTNQWEYVDELITRKFVVEKMNLTFNTILINKKELQAIQYKIYKDVKSTKSGQRHVDPPHIVSTINHYHSIPYNISTKNKTIIAIKYLNNLEE